MNDEQYLSALLSLPGMHAPKVSPDGQWVAWTWFRAGPTAQVYAAPTSGQTPPVQLTQTGEDTLLYSWTPDSQAVIAGHDQGGNERVQLFRIGLDKPLEMRALTEPNPPFFLRGGQLHPNRRFLVYGANFNVETYQEIEPTWVYRHDLQTGAFVPLAKPSRTSFFLPHLSPTGEHVLYNRAELHPAGSQVWLVDIEGHEDREILNFGPDKKLLASWFPDGLRVLFISEGEAYNRLGIYHIHTGETRWLIDDPQFNVEAAFAPFGTSQVVVIEFRGARLQASLVDPESGEKHGLPELAGNLYPLAPAANGEWVGMFYSSRQPHDLVRFPLDDPRPERFTSLSRVWSRTELTRTSLAPAADFRWKSVDGLEIQGWLYRPESQARGTIVFVHGGPTAHSQDQINNQIQFFVRKGFNVLDPNYRGSTGFGLAFRNAIKAEGWGSLEQEDIATGIQALIAAGIAEPGKVGITGTSYGGYSAWHAITHYPSDLIAASAPICGMTDLVVDYETTRPDLRPYSEEMLGGTPEQAPERYHERSPVHFVDRIQGSLLIVQGVQDPNVNPENVRIVRGELQKAGVEYQLLAFEDEGHGISKPSNQRRLYTQLLKFFEEAFNRHAAR